MLWNHIKIALRNLKKNKVFAAVNVLGLALGLAIYLFGGLMYEYEKTHDLFYEKGGSHLLRSVYCDGPNRIAFQGTLVRSTRPSARSSKRSLTDVEAVARTIRREFLISMGADSFYENLHFRRSGTDAHLRLRVPAR